MHLYCPSSSAGELARKLLYWEVAMRSIKGMEKCIDDCVTNFQRTSPVGLAVRKWQFWQSDEGQLCHKRMHWDRKADCMDKDVI